jgi:tetratricopeptide (TPR) repeat protein
MNFLLQMIGRATLNATGIRLTPGQLMWKAATTAATERNFSGALQAYQKYAEMRGGHRSTGELLIRGHLHLAVREYAEAGHYFSAGIARLHGEQEAGSLVWEFSDMAGGADTLPGTRMDENQTNRLERLIDVADAHLRQGRYVRAQESFQQARAMVDTLLAAQAGIVVANAREKGEADAGSARPLVGLAKLGDLLLRMLGRTHLAANVAVGLRERSLRDDLAAWATTGEDVHELLRTEFETMREGVRLNPDHAEMHYRLGLVARAIGDLETAERAFRRVVQLHPHHLLSASRLAATLLQREKTEAVMPLLAVAFAVPAETLKRYEGLAEAAGDRPAFERAVVRLCHDVGGKSNCRSVRANLAFALGELGLLDEERAAWREMVSTP